MDVRFMPTLDSACCVLHNRCEVHGNDFDDDWQCEDKAFVHIANTTLTTGISSTAGVIRSALCDYFD